MIKKYKLIKEYPGSPKLGTIVKSNGRYYTTDNKSSLWVSLSEDIEKHPEFWEEIIEKDYEILSFEDTSNKNVDWEKTGDNEYTHSSGELCNLEDLLYSNHWKIHSVKRLSDGEVFTVGDDIIVRSNNKRKLHSFVLNGDSVLICDNISVRNAMWCLSDIRKCKSLFTTEDGVDIYNEDTYYKVVDFIPVKYVAKDYLDYNYNSISAIRFSTKEAAEEYVIMNKPCLSINDIDTTAISKSGIDRLKQIVKGRI